MPTKQCHNNPDGLLVNSCDPVARSHVFAVDPGEAVILTGCGMELGTKVVVETAVGNPDQDCWCGYSPNGQAVELSPTTSQVLVATPGRYRVNLDGATAAEGECIKVQAEAYAADDIADLASAPFEIPVPCPQLVDTGYVDTETCAKIYAQVTCVAGELQFPAPTGYIDPNTGEFNMAIRITPANNVAPKCEKADLLPFDIVGPAASQTYDDIITAAVAANPATYPTFGSVLATDTVLELDAVEIKGGNFLFNGVETAGVNDPDGVNRANTIEVPDGCTVRVTLCMQQCQDKAGNVV